MADRMVQWRRVTRTHSNLTRPLAEIERLLDARELHCVVNAVVPFAKAADADTVRVEGALGA
jgi:NADPH:quinone reductase-like Zn-dependent oxidoreductase